MGDMAEPWKSMRHDRQMQVAQGKRVSMKYRTEKDREEGIAFAYSVARDNDDWTFEKLDKLGLNPVRKGYSSFQITHNGRVGMYYNGKKGEQIRWNDGEVVDRQPLQSIKQRSTKEDKR